ncbi:MAG: hypothetical protein JSR85_04755 [Proteobacteria bacterium]|nr:hypothetical protein [Pseudomonadota bacterium]
MLKFKTGSLTLVLISFFLSNKIFTAKAMTQEDTEFLVAHLKAGRGVPLAVEICEARQGLKAAQTQEALTQKELEKAISTHTQIQKKLLETLEELKKLNEAIEESKSLCFQTENELSRVQKVRVEREAQLAAIQASASQLKAAAKISNDDERQQSGEGKDIRQSKKESKRSKKKK